MFTLVGSIDMLWHIVNDLWSLRDGTTIDRAVYFGNRLLSFSLSLLLFFDYCFLLLSLWLLIRLVVRHTNNMSASPLQSYFSPVYSIRSRCKQCWIDLLQLNRQLTPLSSFSSIESAKSHRCFLFIDKLQRSRWILICLFDICCAVFQYKSLIRCRL